jgi:hypothetical protein
VLAGLGATLVMSVLVSAATGAFTGFALELVGLEKTRWRRRWRRCSAWPSGCSPARSSSCTWVAVRPPAHDVRVQQAASFTAGALSAALIAVLVHVVRTLRDVVRRR